MPATEAAPKPAPGEIKLDNLGHTGIRPKLDPSILAKAKEMAGEAPDPPKDISLPPKEDKPATTPPAPKEQPKTPEPPKQPEVPDDTPKAPKQLREALDRAQAKVKEVESRETATAKERADAYAKLAEVEARASKYEQEIETTYKPSLEKLSRIEKQLQEREEQLRIRDYTATQEWHEKYIKPEIEIQNEVHGLLSELVVTNEEGNQIPATIQHFEAVISAPNQNEAANRAKALFGPDMAPTVSNYRLRIRTLHNKKQEALKNAQLESAEWEKKQNIAMVQAQELLRKRILDTESKLVQQFKPADDDEELTQALKEGKDLVDRAFQTNLSPEQTGDLIAEFRAEVQKSKVSDKIISRIKKENEELKEQLKQYQKSEPEVITRNSTPGSAVAGPDDARSKLLAAAQAAANSR